MGVLVAAARPASVALSSRRLTAPSSRRFAAVSFSRDASASASRRSVAPRAFGSSSSRAADYHTHVVKPGENLSYIAQDFATSISALREANGMRHANGDPTPLFEAIAASAQAALLWTDRPMLERLLAAAKAPEDLVAFVRDRLPEMPSWHHAPAGASS